MKKNYICVLVCLFSLVGCINNEAIKNTNVQENVNKDIAVQPAITNTNESDNINHEAINVNNKVEHYIKISNPINSTERYSGMGPVYFKGQVSEDAQKIIVTADYTKRDMENGTSTPMQDIYQLTNFKTGDTSFQYGASLDWNNLGLGNNTYTITAYFLDGKEVSTQVDLCLSMEDYYLSVCQ